MKNKLAAFLFGLVLMSGAANAQVYVRVGPPPVRQEVIPVRPGAGYVWTPGYQRWDGRAYNWIPGRYVLPPQPYYHRWVPGHWRRSHGGWVWIEGHWRR